MPNAHAANGIHTRGTPTGVHTVDFLIWIPDYQGILPMAFPAYSVIEQILQKLYTPLKQRSIDTEVDNMYRKILYYISYIQTN